jgi:GTP-binding nuclear protein Ran
MSFTYKVVLMGDGGVGKTTFVNRHLTGKFEKMYVPTHGAQIHKITFYTNVGKIDFNVWDTAGQEKFAGLGCGYYTNADAAIFMFDLTSRITYSNIPDWYMNFKKICGKDKAMVICGNKVDITNRKVKTKRITFPKKRGIEYLDLSAKSNYNFAKVFLSIICQLMKRDDIKFIQEPALKPPEVKLDKKEIEKREKEMEAMQNAIIDDSSSDDDDL